MSGNNAIAFIKHSCNTHDGDNQWSSMYTIAETRTLAFSETSIEEVVTVASSELEQIDEQMYLIESFKQPFPMQERRKPVMDGEMNSYG